MRAVSAAVIITLGVVGLAGLSLFLAVAGATLGLIRAYNDVALRGNSTPAVVAVGVSEVFATAGAVFVVLSISLLLFLWLRYVKKAI